AGSRCRSHPTSSSIAPRSVSLLPPEATAASETSLDPQSFSTTGRSGLHKTPFSYVVDRSREHCFEFAVVGCAFEERTRSINCCALSLWRDCLLSIHGPQEIGLSAEISLRSIASRSVLRVVPSNWAACERFIQPCSVCRCAS